MHLKMKPTCVDHAGAALQALEATLHGEPPFDIAVLDYMMPGCDGFELGGRIANDERFKGTRLVLLTSAHGIRGAEEFEKLGFAAYLLKPVSHRDLRECLGRVMSVDAARWHERTQAIVIADRRHSGVPGRRVLLAEDNLVNQKVARGTLEKMGYAVDIVADGEEAVAAWETGRYHIILMDCQMPVMDGYQATREIRARERAERRIPIIALTADAMKGARQQCLDAGMDDYLTKPLDRARLAETLERHLVTGSEQAGVNQGADLVAQPAAQPPHPPPSPPRTSIRRSIGSSSWRWRTAIGCSRSSWCSCSSIRETRRCATFAPLSIAAICRRSGARPTRSRGRAPTSARNPLPPRPPGWKRPRGPEMPSGSRSWSGNCARKHSGPASTCARAAHEPLQPAVLNSSLRTAGSGVLELAASEWLAESFFINGSMAIAIRVQTMPANPSLLKRLV